MAQITVAERSELKRSKKDKTYFAVKDIDGQTYICYHPNQHPDFENGATVDVVIKPSTNPDYSPSIELAKGEETAPKKDTSAPKSEHRVEPEDTKLKSMAMSYAKDTVVPIAVAALSNKLIKEMSEDKFLTTFTTAIETRILKMSNRFYTHLLETTKIAEKINEET